MIFSLAELVNLRAALVPEGANEFDDERVVYLPMTAGTRMLAHEHLQSMSFQHLSTHLKHKKISTSTYNY